jgi:hypothetical protein
MTLKLLASAGLVAALGLSPVAFAQQRSAPAQGGQMPGMSGTPGMNMQGSDRADMMARCADMRRQMQQGTHQNTPGMADMMRRCDEMDRGMGTMPMGTGNPTAAPPATRSR